MSEKHAEDKKPNTVIGSIAGLLSLYTVFVFMSGWTFLDFYYRRFGIYIRWLDLPIP